MRDLAKFPELVFLDRFDVLVPTVLGFALFGLGAFLQRHAPGLHTTGAQMLIWGFFISTVVLAHGTFTINSLAHVFGRRRYETNDDSRNSFALAMVTLGEGWHNNHHHFPAAARNGFFWWEIDITYYTLKMLEACGIIWDLRQVPPELLDESLLDNPASTSCASRRQHRLQTPPDPRRQISSARTTAPATSKPPAPRNSTPRLSARLRRDASACIRLRRWPSRIQLSRRGLRRRVRGVPLSSIVSRAARCSPVSRESKAIAS